MTERVRAYIYRLTVALGVVGVAFGALTESKASALASLVLVATSGLASKHTSTQALPPG